MLRIVVSFHVLKATYHLRAWNLPSVNDIEKSFLSGFMLIWLNVKTSTESLFSELMLIDFLNVFNHYWLLFFLDEIFQLITR